MKFSFVLNMIVAIAFILIISLIVIHNNTTTSGRDDNYQKVKRQIPLQYDHNIAEKKVHDVIKDIERTMYHIISQPNFHSNSTHSNEEATTDSVRNLSENPSKQDVLYSVDRIVEDSDSVFNLLRRVHVTTMITQLSTARTNAEVFKSKRFDGLRTFDFDVMNRLRISLHAGTTCTRYKDILKQLEIDMVFQSISDVIFLSNPKSFIEYIPVSDEDVELSSAKNDDDIVSTYSYTLSRRNPYLTTVLIKSKSPQHDDVPSIPNNNNIKSHCKVYLPSTNLFIADNTIHHPSSDIYGFNENYDCVQLVNNLQLLVQDALPFEFEATLARVLCQCNTTYIPNMLPSDPYFSYWDSLNHLLDLAQSSTTAAAVKQCTWFIFIEKGKTLNRVSNTFTIIKRNNVTQHNNNNVPVPSQYRNYLPISSLTSLSLEPNSIKNLWSSVSHYFHDNNENIDISILNFDSITGSSSGTSTVFDKNLLMRLYVKGSMIVDDSDLNTSFIKASPFMKVQKIYETNNDQVASPGVLKLSPKIFNNPSLSTNVVGVGSTQSHPSSTVKNMPIAMINNNNVIKNKNMNQHRRLQAKIQNVRPIEKEDSLPALDSGDVSWDIMDSGIGTEEESINVDEIDMKIKEHINILQKKAPYIATSNVFPMYQLNKKSAYSISSNSRKLQRRLQLKESVSYEKLMKLLEIIDNRSEFHESYLDKLKRSKLVFIMGKYISLFSLKLSKQLSQQYSRLSRSRGNNSSNSRGGSSNANSDEVGIQKTIIASLFTDSSSIQSHNLLIRIMGLRNNLICNPTWNLHMISSLIVSPERGDLSLIQVDVVIALITEALLEEQKIDQFEDNNQKKCAYKITLIEQSLAILLSISSTSFIDIPSIHLLKHLFYSLTPSCAGDLIQWYTQGNIIDSSLLELKLNAKIHLTPINIIDPSTDSIHTYLVNIEYHLPNDVKTCKNCKFKLKTSNNGLSLYTALQMGLVSYQKKIFLKMLIDFPLWRMKTKNLKIGSWNMYINLSLLKSGSSNNNKGGQKTVVQPSWSLHYYDDIDIHNELIHLSEEITHQKVPTTATSIGVHGIKHDAHLDRKRGLVVWNVLKKELDLHSVELAEGKFSFIEHNSGYGYVSTRLAGSFPNATIFSIVKDSITAGHHVSMLNKLDITNNAVCLTGDTDELIYKNIYESPELFRFQLNSNSLLDTFIKTKDLQHWGKVLAMMLSTALTSFIYTPASAQVSWAMFLIYHEIYEFHEEFSDDGHGNAFHMITMNTPFRSLDDVLDKGTDESWNYHIDFESIDKLNFLSQHPQYAYKDFESQWLIQNNIIDVGHTAVQISPLDMIKSAATASNTQSMMNLFPLIRCDIVNMTRHVHHHYDYAKDGHSRTYTMEIVVNETLTSLINSYLGDTSQAHVKVTNEGLILFTDIGNINHIYHKEMEGNELIMPREDQQQLLQQQQVNKDSSSEKGQSYKILSTGEIMLPLGSHPNQHRIVDVHLLRDRDDFPIPYVTIYGVTLIAALRLGLENHIRDSLFQSFLNLPLYEDMAPWNIVLMGSV